MIKMIIIALLGTIVLGCSKDDSEPIEEPPVIEVLDWEQLPLSCGYVWETTWGCKFRVEVLLRNNTDEQVCATLHAEFEPDWDEAHPPGENIVIANSFSLHPYQEKTVSFGSQAWAIYTNGNTSNGQVGSWEEHWPYILTSEIVVVDWDCSELFD